MATNTKKITAIERLNNSANGNPRFRINFDDESSAITEPDAAFAYSVGNIGLREGSTVDVRYKAGQIVWLARHHD